MVGTLQPGGAEKAPFLPPWCLVSLKTGEKYMERIKTSLLGQIWGLVFPKFLTIYLTCPSKTIQGADPGR